MVKKKSGVCRQKADPGVFYISVFELYGTCRVCVAYDFESCQATPPTDYVRVFIHCFIFLATNIMTPAKQSKCFAGVCIVINLN